MRRSKGNLLAESRVRVRERVMSKLLRRAAFSATVSTAMTAVMVVAPGLRSNAFAEPQGLAGTLALASANAIELVSPTTGAVMRTVRIPDTYELALNASEQDSQMALSPNGKMAYVTVTLGPGAFDVEPSPPEILAVPLDGGRPTVAVSGAIAPAVSPDGERLAYLEDSAPPDGTAVHRPSETVMVLNLKSRTRESFDLRAAYAEANGPVDVNGLSWSPSGATLAVSVVQFADVYGSFDSVGMLDLHAAVSPEDNPKQLRVRGIASIPPATNPSQFIPGFQSATYITHGDLAVINAEPGQTRPCSQPANSCGIVKYQVLSIDPSSGRAKVNLNAPMRQQAGWFAIDQLAHGAHGDLFMLGRSDVCTLCQPMRASAETLFAVTHGIPIRLGHRAGYRAIAWIRDPD
jgi:hypothetical protein